MADYQRFISYIYAYDGEIKLKNVGFAKMEERGGQCRISVSLKGAHGTGSQAEVYVVRREPGGLAKMQLGTVEIRAGQGDFAYAAPIGQIGQWTGRLADLSGLYITDGGERSFFTGWDDEPVDLTELQGKAPKPREKTAGTEAAEEMPMQAAEVERPVEREKSEPRATDRWSEPQPERQTAKQLLEVAPEHPREKFWDSLCKICPKMLAAPGTEAWQLLEIQIQDIGRLPRKNWIYGNNSFLVQGFYQYRHLALARKDSETGPVYWLGVPGTQNETERLISGMFGFREFLPGNRRKEDGFGYWCTEVTMQDHDL